MPSETNKESDICSSSIRIVEHQQTRSDYMLEVRDWANGKWVRILKLTSEIKWKVVNGVLIVIFAGNKNSKITRKRLKNSFVIANGGNSRTGEIKKENGEFWKTSKNTRCRFHTAIRYNSPGWRLRDIQCWSALIQNNFRSVSALFITWKSLNSADSALNSAENENFQS